MPGPCAVAVLVAFLLFVGLGTASGVTRVLATYSGNYRAETVARLGAMSVAFLAAALVCGIAAMATSLACEALHARANRRRGCRRLAGAEAERRAALDARAGEGSDVGDEGDEGAGVE